jgi:hypothetical protein
MTMRATLSLWVAWALGGCNTSEPAPEPSAEEPAIAAAPSAEAAGRAGEGGAETPVAGEPTEVPAADADPDPTAAPPVEPAAAGSTPAPADIQAFFSSYPEDALEDPRYTARKLPKRAEELRGLLDVRPLLGQPVLASPRPDADVIATIAPEGLVTPTESCMWVMFQQEIEWTKGRIRCGDVFLRQPDTGEGNEEMVPVLETVTVKGTRWSRIIATNGGRTGWVKTAKAPTRFSKVLGRYAAGGSRTWDRMLYAEPGASPTKIEFRGAIALAIRGTRTVDGRTWLRVEARVDQCIEGSRRKLGEGWLPQHAEDGALNVYYELSC